MNMIALQASSLKEFEQLLQVSQPDLVIADLNLPDGTAFSLLAGSLENQLWPVLVMTSYGDEEMAVKAIKSGALDYIVKSPEVFKNIEHVVKRNLRDWNNFQKSRENEKKIQGTYLKRWHRELYIKISRGRLFLPIRLQKKYWDLALEQMKNTTSWDSKWKAIHEDGSVFSGEVHPAVVALQTGLPVRDTIMGINHPQKNEYTWLLINAIPQFRGDDTKPYQVFTTFTDITLLKLY